MIKFNYFIFYLNIFNFFTGISTRKPPLIPKAQPNKKTQTNGKNGPRVRSASTGRDKKSEMQARYWALLFGNLQRAVNEIYQTVECYENISSCQEAILVLENYVRDFKALAEWFKVSGDYDTSHNPQRPQSLAWEVRKSNPAPRKRGKSLSSPVISGKSSPSYSGKNSPCPTIEENRISPRKSLENKINVRELFSPPHAEIKQDLNVPEITILCNGDSKKSDENIELTFMDWNDIIEVENSLKKATSSSQTELEIISNDEVPTDNLSEIEIQKIDCSCQTDLDDDNLTLCEYLEKLAKKKEMEVVTENEENKIPIIDVKKQVLSTPVKYSSVLKPSQKQPVVVPPKKLSTIVNRNPVKIVKVQERIQKSVTTPNISSTTTTRPLAVKSATTSNIKNQNLNPTTTQKSGSKSWVPSNVANRLTARSKTMIEISSNKKPEQKFVSGNLSSRKSSREEFGSSTSTLIASQERLELTNNLRNEYSNKSLKLSDRRSEPKTMPSSVDAAQTNDGWLTVKNKRRSSLHWTNRFNQPTGYASLPTLALLNENPNDEKDEPIKTDLCEKENEEKPLKKIEKKLKISNNKNQTKKSIVLTKKTTTNLNLIKKEDFRRINSAPTRIALKDTVLRQKSDLTGVKLKSLRKEFLRNEKLNALSKQKSSSDEHLKKIDDLCSEEEDSASRKVDMNIQTNMGISQAITDLYHQNCNLWLSESNRNLSNEELEEKDVESDEDQRKLLEEQESLERQIRELESTGEFFFF